MTAIRVILRFFLRHQIWHPPPFVSARFDGLVLVNQHSAELTWRNDSCLKPVYTLAKARCIALEADEELKCAFTLCPSFCEFL